MKDLMKNKMMLIGIAAIVIVVAIAGYLFVSKQKTAKEPVVEQAPEEQALEMKPEEIGLELTPNKALTEVVMKINDVSKFNHFDFEMSYDAIVDGEAVPKGAIGSGDINPGETSVERKITIGTCSSGTCKYDKGVKKISIVITLDLKDGKKAVVKKDLDLEN